MANSNSQMHRKELEEKASRIKEISITEKKGTEVEKMVMVVLRSPIHAN